MTSVLDFSLNGLFLRSGAERPPLRIGVMLDGTTVRGYARRALEDIAASDFARIVCYISNEVPPVAEQAPAGRDRRIMLLRRLTDRAWRRSLGYAAYEKWVVYPRAPLPDPLAPSECSDLMLKSLVLRVRPTQRGFVDRLAPHDVDNILQMDLDVLLRFGFRILRGPVLKAARHGVWSFHHGDSHRYRGGPPHLWELMERNPVSGVVLQRLTEQLDAGEILARGLFATTPSLSVAENRFGPYWSSQHFVIRCLHELHERRRIDRQPSTLSTYAGRRPIYRTPTNLELAKWLVPEIARRTSAYVLRRARRREARHQETPHWEIALRPAITPVYERDDSDALVGFRWHANLAGHYRADPFLLDRASDTWVFFEDFDERTRKGSIGCGRVTGAGEIVEARTVLTTAFHLSYPHVFEHEGEHYMVPECHQSGAVRLYRARRFPDDWREEAVLLPIGTVDNTLFQHNGEWWMLASPRVVPGHAALTYVWRSQQLHGQWRLASHLPLNDDVRSARGAGRVFDRGGELWRPCQDCSVNYGRALAFNSIERLGDAPVERMVRMIQPVGLSGLVGIHTYNRSREWEVIDGFFA